MAGQRALALQGNRVRAAGAIRVYAQRAVAHLPSLVGLKDTPMVHELPEGRVEPQVVVWSKLARHPYLRDGQGARTLVLQGHAQGAALRVHPAGCRNTEPWDTRTTRARHPCR